MELLFVKSKEPLTIESYLFDTMKDATSFYTQHSNEKVFVGFYDSENNRLLTLAENDSEVEVYNKFIQNIINDDTEVTHVYKDALFETNG